MSFKTVLNMSKCHRNNAIVTGISWQPLNLLLKWIQVVRCNGKAIGWIVGVSRSANGVEEMGYIVDIDELLL